MRDSATEGQGGWARWAIRGSLPICASLMLSACAAVKWDPVANYHHSEVSPTHFEVCYNHGCADQAEVRLKLSQWMAVYALFEPVPSTPREERKQIAAAIALMERMTGEQAGTDGDVGGTFSGFGLMRQLDCVDETVNTTTYLILLRDQGLIHWHNVANPATRGYFVTGWPHATAVIEDKETGEKFAVDSWFGDNGEPPAIVALPEWLDGWKPNHA